mgnify:CR=1 FL=1
MNDDWNATMADALRLTREGRPMEATALLQQGLGGTGQPAPARAVTNRMLQSRREAHPSNLSRVGGLLDTLNDDALGAIDASLPLQSLSLMDLSLRLAERRAGLSRALAASTAAETPAMILMRVSICASCPATSGAAAGLPSMTWPCKATSEWCLPKIAG